MILQTPDEHIGRKPTSPRRRTRRDFFRTARTGFEWAMVSPLDGFLNLLLQVRAEGRKSIMQVLDIQFTS